MRVGRALQLALTILCFLVLLPIIISVAIILRTLKYRRLRRAAASFKCRICHHVLGVASIRLADEATGKLMDELRLSQPSVKLRVVQVCNAICASCGARYTFDKEDGTFVLSSQR